MGGLKTKTKLKLKSKKKKKKNSTMNQRKESFLLQSCQWTNSQACSHLHQRGRMKLVIFGGRKEFFWKWEGVERVPVNLKGWVCEIKMDGWPGISNNMKLSVVRSLWDDVLWGSKKIK